MNRYGYGTVLNLKCIFLLFGCMGYGNFLSI